MKQERHVIEDAIRACRKARTEIDGSGSFRTCLLLDMLLLELGKDLAQIIIRDNKPKGGQA